MFRIFSPLLFILLSVSFAFSQAKTNQAIAAQIKSLKAEKYLSLNYDKGSNVTKILAFGEDFGRDQDKNNKLSAFSFGMTFNYAGDQLTVAPDAFILTFWAKANQPRFAAAHDLKALTNGETLDLGDARYATKPREKGMEYLNFVISRENLKKIAADPNPRMTIGGAEFKFTPEHLKLFRAILAISELS